MKKVHKILIAFLLGFVILWFLFPIRYPLPLLTPVKGLDVSHHQGRIDWSQVQKSRVQFAWIKASEGGDFRDSLFQVNWVDAKKHGVPRGAYHFLTFCKSGKEQAQNFIDAVRSFDSTDLIPMVDVEYGGNCKKRLTQVQMETLLDDFTRELMTVSAKPPIIYVTHDIYKKYFEKMDLRHKVWGRAILFSPCRFYGSDWDIWQYNYRGSVEGIKGPVDLNVLNERSLDGMYNR